MAAGEHNAQVNPGTYVRLPGPAVTPVKYTLTGMTQPLGGGHSPLRWIAVLGLAYLVVAPYAHLPGGVAEEDVLRRIEEAFGQQPTTRSTPPAQPPASSPQPTPAPTPPVVHYPVYPQPEPTPLPPVYPVAVIVADQADAQVEQAAGVPLGALYRTGYDPLSGQPGEGYGVPSYLPIYTGSQDQPQQTLVIGVAGHIMQGSLGTLVGQTRTQTSQLLQAWIAGHPQLLVPATGEVPVA